MADKAARGGKAAAKEERKIQAKIDAKAKTKSKSAGKADKPLPQAGARKYPTPPFPEQHLKKPGLESDVNPAPMYDAPYYKGSGKLEGMVAIITGGDSGIGRSVAVLFAREGCDVAVCHVDEAGDAEVVKAAVEKEGRRCILIAGDVADPQFAPMAVERTVKAFGKLDILVNNAAFQEHVEAFEDLTNEHFDRTLKTNLYGYFYMAKAAVPHMKAGSSIINTGSITGIDGSKELIDYSMTKGGIHAWTRAMSGMLIKKGIRINVVAPGPVWTPLNPADKAAPDVSKFGSATVMKRPAQPEEIAPAYVFLASPQMSSFITGEILPIIGGYGE